MSITIPSHGQSNWDVPLNAALTALQPAVGLLSARPPASAATGQQYFATDVAGGTLYQSNGTTWTAWTAGVNAVAGTELAYAETTTDPATTSTTPVDAVGLTGITFTTTSTGKTLFMAHAQVYNTVAGDGIIATLIDSNSGTEYARFRFTSAAASAIADMHAYGRWVLTASTSYTVKLQVQAVTGGVAHFVTNAAAPKIVASVTVLSA